MLPTPEDTDVNSWGAPNPVLGERSVPPNSVLELAHFKVNRGQILTLFRIKYAPGFFKMLGQRDPHRAWTVRVLANLPEVCVVVRHTSVVRTSCIVTSRAVTIKYSKNYKFNFADVNKTKLL